MTEPNLDLNVANGAPAVIGRGGRGGTLKETKRGIDAYLRKRGLIGPSRHRRSSVEEAPIDFTRLHQMEIGLA